MKILGMYIVETVNRVKRLTHKKEGKQMKRYTVHFPKGEDLFYKTKEEIFDYFGNPEGCEDMWDLQEYLRHEDEGMAYPIIEEEEDDE